MLFGLAAGLVGAAGMTALQATPTAAAVLQSEEDDPLVGTWDVTFSDVNVDTPPRHATALFLPGGGLLNVQENFPTAGVGTWGRDEGNSASFKVVQWDYRDGIPAARVELTGVVHRGPHDAHDTIFGTYTSAVSRNGVVFERGSFKFFGERLTAG